MLAPNGISNVLIEIPLSAYSRAIMSENYTNTMVSRTQAAVAIRAFEYDHERLPASFDKLVPDYLESVPLDDYDGEPMRYDPSRYLIWGVGPDLIDNGGDEEEDVTWPILSARNGQDLQD